MTSNTNGLKAGMDGESARDQVPILGVGFGVANLALAVALDELGMTGCASFFERKNELRWHEGMLIDNSRLQVSFLKDLVTMRNPQSPFSFVAYLHSRGRLSDFINAGTACPLRVEFDDYLRWTAAGIRADVNYGSEVCAMAPVADASGQVTSIDVTVATGSGRRHVRARDLVLGAGSAPHLPVGAELSGRIWHSSQLLTKIDELDGRASRFVVVGAGQSAAEVAQYLYHRFPTADIHAVMARYGYTRADDSSFANRVFDPDAMFEFYDSTPDVKDSLLGYHANTNYSVVDGVLIDALYDQHYVDLVRGAPRLHFENMSTAVPLASSDQYVDVELTRAGSGAARTLRADVLIFATGYRPVSLLQMVGCLRPYCLLDEHGQPRVTRDFRLMTSDHVRSRVFLQGGTEHSHGVGSVLISNMAIRAGEIANALSIASPAR